jgi:hypothetical protein
MESGRVSLFASGVDGGDVSLLSRMLGFEVLSRETKPNRPMAMTELRAMICVDEQKCIDRD